MFMRDDLFWNGDKGCVSAVLNSVNRMTENSYVFVVNKNSHWTWCSAKMRAYFGMDAEFVSDISEELRALVHPHDLDEYTKGMKRRMDGLDLDIEFCIRIRGLVREIKEYCMFSFHMERYVEGPDTDYIVAVMKNENVPPQIDALTDLYSHARYGGDLQHFCETVEYLAVLEISIERFNNFSMIYGAPFANRLLQEVALTFIYMMDAESAVYRLDGGKFAFILRRRRRDGLAAFEKRVRQALSEEIFVEGRRTSLKISAGAILLDHYTGDAAMAQSQVEYALNHSQQRHQGRLVIFNDEVRVSEKADLNLMRVIHESVREGCRGFYVEYQPVVGSDSSRVVGVEALVRWCMEPYGKVPPGYFIEWMETDPSMYELGNFVLRTALRDGKRFLEIQPDFFMNVNISARQMERYEFREEVLNILRETGFPADRLCMELTERCRDFPVDKIRREVEFFQSYGIRFAMDDYGTGSASSGIVLDVPMDEIKLDMSFVRGIKENPKNQAMVKSIVDFANMSGMSTCLEGVETEELQDYLRSYGATWFQGYYYSKPVPVAEIEQILTAQTAPGRCIAACLEEREVVE